MSIVTKAKQHFFDHFFFYILAIFIIITTVAAYYRFMVSYDYIVSYEGSCNPEENVCFTGCEDEECSEVYYYSFIQKYALDLYEQCGKNITDCEEANICLENDSDCSITYCDLEMDGESCSAAHEETSEQYGDHIEQGVLEGNIQDN